MPALIVSDMLGHVVLNAAAGLKVGLNAFNVETAAWPAGIYSVQIAGANWKAATRLVVAH